MSGLWKLAAVPLLLCFLMYMLRELGFRGAQPVAAVGIALRALSAVGSIGVLFDTVGLAEIAEGAEDVTACALKIVGVGYLFGFVSDVCRDLGESGLASSVTVAGRVEILAIALPFLWKILDYSLELLG